MIDVLAHFLSPTHNGQGWIKMSHLFSSWQNQSRRRRMQSEYIHLRMDRVKGVREEKEEEGARMTQADSTDETLSPTHIPQSRKIPR